MHRPLNRIRLVLAVLATLAPLALTAQPNTEALRAMGEVKALNDKVKSFRANLEVHDKQGQQEQVTTSTLSLSKDLGWHIRSSSEGQNYEFICDFEKFYQYYPQEKRAYMHNPGPELQPMLRKPVTDLNPLTLLDVNTLKYKGRAEIAGEPVYHFEGTTSTQFLPQGKPVERKMDAWISAKDGLPRKTVETVGPAIGTTLYTNVEVNPGYGTDEFKFTPPPGVQVIDATAQMKAMEEQEKKNAENARKGAPADAGTSSPSAPGALKPGPGDEKPKD